MEWRSTASRRSVGATYLSTSERNCLGAPNILPWKTFRRDLRSELLGPALNSRPIEGAVSSIFGFMHDEPAPKCKVNLLQLHRGRGAVSHIDGFNAANFLFSWSNVFVWHSVLIVSYLILGMQLLEQAFAEPYAADLEKKQVIQWLWSRSRKAGWTVWIKPVFLPSLWKLTSLFSISDYDRLGGSTMLQHTTFYGLPCIDQCFAWKSLEEYETRVFTRSDTQVTVQMRMTPGALHDL